MRALSFPQNLSLDNKQVVKKTVSKFLQKISYACNTSLKQDTADDRIVHLSQESDSVKLDFLRFCCPYFVSSYVNRRTRSRHAEAENRSATLESEIDDDAANDDRNQKVRKWLSIEGWLL